MSELKAHKAYNRWIDEEMPTPNDDLICNEVYLKSEADKYINLLKDKANYNEYAYKHKSEELADTCRFYEDEIRHNKYKRCLAMAGWCEATALWCYQAAHTLPTGFRATLFGKPVMIEPDRLFDRFERLIKWSNRWMNLAKKFKPSKK